MRTGQTAGVEHLHLCSARNKFGRDSQPGNTGPRQEPAGRIPSPAPVPEPVPDPGTPPQQPPGTGMQPPEQPVPPPPGETGRQAPPMIPPEPAPRAGSPAPPEPGGQASWPEFMNILQTKLPFIFALFSKGRIKTDDDKRILVELNACSAFEKSRLKTKKQELQALANTYLGKAVEVEIGTQSNPGTGPSEAQSAQDKARHAAARHPMVQEARRIFDGEIL